MVGSVVFNFCTEKAQLSVFYLLILENINGYLSLVVVVILIY